MDFRTPNSQEINVSPDQEKRNLSSKREEQKTSKGQPTTRVKVTLFMYNCVYMYMFVCVYL